jgi:hypothetical protein
MPVSFEGFPRTLQRSALRPGRWFVAADGQRALLCFATDVTDADERLALVFQVAGVEKVDVVTVPISVLIEPFGTVEDEVVFAPGQSEGLPMLVPPIRRAFRHGALLRLTNGDLGIGVAPRTSGRTTAVSLTSGAQCEGFDLVFERWSLALRRGGEETRVGYFKPNPMWAGRRDAGV